MRFDTDPPLINRSKSAFLNYQCGTPSKTWGQGGIRKWVGWRRWSKWPTYYTKSQNIFYHFSNFDSMRIESWIDIIIIMTPLRKVYVRTTPNNVFLSVWRPSEKFLKLFVSNGFFFVCGEWGVEEGGHFYYAKILRQLEILNFKRFTSLSWSLLQKIFLEVIDIHVGHCWVAMYLMKKKDYFWNSD